MPVLAAWSLVQLARAPPKGRDGASPLLAALHSLFAVVIMALWSAAKSWRMRQGVVDEL